MDCQKCGVNSASVHIIKESNGKKDEFFLCTECATGFQQKGIGFTMAFDPALQVAFHNFLPGFIEYGKGLGGTLTKESLCNGCGLTFEEFQKNGKLGCGICYATFQKQLTPILNRIHGSVSYKGKQPYDAQDSMPKASLQLEDLKKLLQDAIAQEAYEQAAKIRDEIREMERRNTKEEGGV